MNGYNLLREWYDHKFEHPDKFRHIHSDLYCFIIDLWNRLGQKDKFGLPTASTMESLGIGSYNTYKKALQDLIESGFIKIISDSKNQHVSKIISIRKTTVKRRSKLDDSNLSAISKSDKATDKPLDEASDKATDDITKQENKETTIHPLLKWLDENCKRVQQMKEPLTDSDAELIVTEFDRKAIIEVFEAMDNSPKLKNYISAVKTFKGWLKVRQKDNPNFGLKVNSIAQPAPLMPRHEDMQYINAMKQIEAEKALYGDKNPNEK